MSKNPARIAAHRATAPSVPFDVLNRATWEDVMLVEHVAAIYHRKVGGIRKACQARTFVPAPFQKHPYRWRKSDVLRHLDGAKAVPLKKASGF